MKTRKANCKYWNIKSGSIINTEVIRKIVGKWFKGYVSTLGLTVGIIIITYRKFWQIFLFQSNTIIGNGKNYNIYTFG